MKWIILTTALLTCNLIQASEYDFDWKGRNDMRGAWMMCATTGFTLGECPSVLAKCWLPPMIYLKCRRGKCKTKTHCVKLPNFGVSQDEIGKSLEYARQQVGLTVDSGRH